jgi:hypothetical protein
MTNAEHDFATMQDFLVGRLSDDERRAFEHRLVREPELVRELEQSLRMREGLQQLRTRGYFRKNVSRARPSPIWVSVLAAAACAGFALFLWQSRVTGPAPILLPSLASHTPAEVASLVRAHFTFVAVRGGLVPDLELPPTGLIEIRAAPSSRAAVSYRMTLARQVEGSPAQPVAKLSDLVLGADGYLHCYADGARLIPGNYVLRIETDANVPGTTDTFPFKLHARDTRLSR